MQVFYGSGLSRNGLLTGAVWCSRLTARPWHRLFFLVYVSSLFLSFFTLILISGFAKFFSSSLRHFSIYFQFIFFKVRMHLLCCVSSTLAPFFCSHLIRRFMFKELQITNRLYQIGRRNGNITEKTDICSFLAPLLSFTFDFIVWCLP